MVRSLIVEDNPINYMVMRNQLLKHGIAAEVCQNGQEAVDYCITKGIPDLILLDGYMPIMDGIAFVSWIRNYPGGDHPYILFCSSSIDRIDAAEALRQGADCHHPKPISAAALHKAIDIARSRTTSSKAVK